MFVFLEINVCFSPYDKTIVPSNIYMQRKARIYSDHLNISIVFMLFKLDKKNRNVYSEYKNQHKINIIINDDKDVCNVSS